MFSFSFLQGHVDVVIKSVLQFDNLLLAQQCNIKHRVLSCSWLILWNLILWILWAIISLIQIHLLCIEFNFNISQSWEYDFTLSFAFDPKFIYLRFFDQYPVPVLLMFILLELWVKATKEVGVDIPKHSLNVIYSLFFHIIFKIFHELFIFMFLRIEARL